MCVLTKSKGNMLAIKNSSTGIGSGRGRDTLHIRNRPGPGLGVQNGYRSGKLLVTRSGIAVT